MDTSHIVINQGSDTNTSLGIKVKKGVKLFFGKSRSYLKIVSFMDPTLGVVAAVALLKFFTSAVMLVAVMLLFPKSIHAFNTSVSVDSNNPGSYANPGVWGVNYEGYSIADTLSDFYSYNHPKSRLQEMNLQFIRYPGGCPADFYDFHTDLKKYYSGATYKEDTLINIQEVVQLAKDVNAQVLYQVNISVRDLQDPCGSVPGYPSRSLSESQKTQLLLDDLRTIATTYKDEIRYWELGNEQWQWYQYYSPTYYFSTALKFAEVLKSIDPTFKVGLVGMTTQYNPNDPTNFPQTADDSNWTNQVKYYKNRTCVNATVPCFDFVTDHPYSEAGYNPAGTASYNFPGQAAWYPLTNSAWAIDRRVQEYSPLKLAVTEWNMVCWTGANRAVGTVEHGFFTGESLALMAQKGVLIANFHDLSYYGQSGCAMLGKTPPNFEYKLFPAGDAFKLSSVLMGTNILETSVTTQTINLPFNASCNLRQCYRGGVVKPYVSVYIGKTTDNQKYQILMFNRHRTDSSSTVVNGLPSGFNLATQKQLTAGAYTDLSFQSASTSFAVSQPMNITLPPLSITAITLTQSDLPTPVPTPIVTPTVIPTPTATPGILGDINGDGVVNIQDFVILSNNFGTANSAADLNRDGVVNIQDFVILSNNFGKTTPPPTPTPATPTPPVLPTPGTSTPIPTPIPTPTPVLPPVNYRIQGLRVVTSSGLNRCVLPACSASLSFSPSNYSYSHSDTPSSTGTCTSATCSYSYSNIPSNVNVTVTAQSISGYTTGYTICYNDVNCHDPANITWVNQVVVDGYRVQTENRDAGEPYYADLHWHYRLN